MADTHHPAVSGQLQQFTCSRPNCSFTTTEFQAAVQHWQQRGHAYRRQEPGQSPQPEPSRSTLPELPPVESLEDKVDT
ncbi:MAG: hypothetical protein ACJ8AT_34900, partial [Hyalangium sp.]|uniref:hypothetical protein n=1 Tax=Hyalangium sp. TaxID=2028555 RepID=UPI00389AF893